MSLPALRHLAALTEAHPSARKILVAPTLIWGRETLRSLARHTGGWVGWETATLRSLAEACAITALAEAGVRIGSDIEVAALIGSALDEAVGQGEAPASWAALVQSPGFRTAVTDRVLELRMAVVTLPSSAGRTDNIAALAHVAARTAARLAEQQLTDAAGVFATALDAFDREAPFVLGDLTTLAPGLETRGHPGRFLARLQARGATVLDTATFGQHMPAATSLEARSGNPAVVRTFASPDTDIFVAATVDDEVREALRRALAEGYRLDQVELVATDPDSYATALDALCQQLGSGVTLTQGLPAPRARACRAVGRMLDWLNQDLSADVLREAMESGDLTVIASDSGTDAADLFHAFRSLHIGWGYDRYHQAIARLDDGRWIDEQLQRTHRTADADTSTELLRTTAAQLSAFLTALIKALPPLPERTDRDTPLPPSAVPLFLLHVLDQVPAPTNADQFNTTRLRNRLNELVRVNANATDTTLGTATSDVQALLAELRVWRDVAPNENARLARGGAVHLSDIRHAGTAGRPRVFVLGLDADRCTGPTLADPLLPDALRDECGELATAATRRAEKRWSIVRAMAESGSRVTFSYAIASDGNRNAGPSTLLLDAARELWSDPALDYSGLQARLGVPAGAVPQAASSALDQRDIWLAALASGANLLDGSAQVRSRFPALNAGLRGVAALGDPAITPFHGLVPAAAGHFGPGGSSRRTLSPSAMELLSNCPLAWFYKYALRLRLPDDPTWDQAQWLDPLQRGSLLHALFEQVIITFHDDLDRLADDEAVDAVRAIADALLTAERAITPPPSEAIFARERAEILRTGRSFLEMERAALRRGTRATSVKTEFALQGPRALVTLADGRLVPINGRLDRIDQLPDGTSVIIDYKTGSPGPYVKANRPPVMNGGRLLQPLLYTAAYAAVTGDPVSRFEYRFPTERASNHVVAFSASELREQLGLVSDVLDPLTSGAFLPTDDAGDCGYCDFADICRATRPDAGFGKTRSPRVEWAARISDAAPEYALMHKRRDKKGGEE